jgi:hypothetical protein
MYLPAHVRPTTPKKMMLAAPPTAQMKKNLNSALVRKDCTYFITAYALIKAKTPGERGKKERCHRLPCPLILLTCYHIDITVVKWFKIQIQVHTSRCHMFTGFDWLKSNKWNLH